MATSKTNNPRIYLALITVQILFGINYVATKFIIGAFPPLIWANLRLIISSVILFCIAFSSQRKRPVLNRKFFSSIAFFSLLGVILNQSSFLVGLKYTSATNSSILSTLIPVFTLIFVTVSGREPFTPRRGFGFLFALIGVLVIRNIENLRLSDQTWLGDALTIFNCVSYALFLTLSKKFMEKHDSLWTTTWLFAFGGIGLTLISLPGWTQFHLPELNSTILTCMSFSIFGGTLLAYLLNNWALARIQSSSVALFVYIQPIIASFSLGLRLAKNSLSERCYPVFSSSEECF